MCKIIIITTREPNKIELKERIYNIPNLKKIHQTKTKKVPSLKNGIDSKFIKDNLMGINNPDTRDYIELNNALLNIDSTNMKNLLNQNKRDLPSVFFNNILDDLSDKHSFYDRKHIFQLKNNQDNDIDVFYYRCFEKRNEILNNNNDFLTALIKDITLHKGIENDKLDDFFKKNSITLIVHRDDIGYESEKKDKYSCLQSTNGNLSEYFVKENELHKIYPFSHISNVFLDIIEGSKYKERLARSDNIPNEIDGIITESLDQLVEFEDFEKKLFQGEQVDFDLGVFNSKPY